MEEETLQTFQTSVERDTPFADDVERTEEELAEMEEGTTEEEVEIIDEE